VARTKMPSAATFTCSELNGQISRVYFRGSRLLGTNMTYQNARMQEDGHSTRSVYCLVAYRGKNTEKLCQLGILLDRSHAMPVRCLGRISSVLSLDKS
jgi:hypothetical protein